MYIYIYIRIIIYRSFVGNSIATMEWLPQCCDNVCFCFFPIFSHFFSFCALSVFLLEIRADEHDELRQAEKTSDELRID